ncbi:nucleotide sugar dehydrogenase [bacterium]|nr:nucleotide sugar dehydrogenase [bacterium]
MVIGVVGLGYVGLPLAIALGKVFQTIGFDISPDKVARLRERTDLNGQVSADEFSESIGLSFTTNSSDLANVDVVIIVVPTPINSSKKPDLTALTAASELVGSNMKKGAVIVYESTVYPGLTEEVCIPILEKFSHFTWKRDFNVGYSPERINPSDNEHTIQSVAKIVSGDCDETIQKLVKIYSSIIQAEIFEASSIKVAEAAKVIENTQRDLNIALINELAIIFNLMGLNTKEVIEAASTKWNFIPFSPGLVGGHCIGVDPYYLLFKAEKLGYNPEVITAGRRINDGMAAFVAQQTVKLMTRSNSRIVGSTILVLGVTFKENCFDMRNSKVPDVVRELQEYGCSVFVDDPVALPEEISKVYSKEYKSALMPEKFDVVILAVPHLFYCEKRLASLLINMKSGGLFVDVKSAFSEIEAQDIGCQYWSL